MQTINKMDLREIAQNRFVRFSAVGGVATLIQFVLLYFFVELNWLEKVPASALSFAISAIFNYLMNYHLTFDSRESHRQTFPKFVGVAGFGLLLNVSLFSLFLLVAHYLIAQAFATLITLCTNFLLHKYWIYRSPQ
jgi:putative flippase GtrA